MAQPLGGPRPTAGMHPQATRRLEWRTPTLGRLDVCIAAPARRTPIQPALWRSNTDVLPSRCSDRSHHGVHDIRPFQSPVARHSHGRDGASAFDDCGGLLRCLHVDGLADAGHAPCRRRGGAVVVRSTFGHEPSSLTRHSRTINPLFAYEASTKKTDRSVSGCSRWLNTDLVGQTCTLLAH